METWFTLQLQTHTVSSHYSQHTALLCDWWSCACCSIVNNFLMALNTWGPTSRSLTFIRLSSALLAELKRCVFAASQLLSHQLVLLWITWMDLHKDEFWLLNANQESPVGPPDSGTSSQSIRTNSCWVKMKTRTAAVLLFLISNVFRDTETFFLVSKRAAMLVRLRSRNSGPQWHSSNEVQPGSVWDPNPPWTEDIMFNLHRVGIVQLF